MSEKRCHAERQTYGALFGFIVPDVIRSEVGVLVATGLDSTPYTVSSRFNRVEY